MLLGWTAWVCELYLARRSSFFALGSTSWWEIISLFKGILALESHIGLRQRWHHCVGFQFFELVMGLEELLLHFPKLVLFLVQLVHYVVLVVVGCLLRDLVCRHRLPAIHQHPFVRDFLLVGWGLWVVLCVRWRVLGHILLLQLLRNASLNHVRMARFHIFKI